MLRRLSANYKIQNVFHRWMNFHLPYDGWRWWLHRERLPTWGDAINFEIEMKLDFNSSYVHRGKFMLSLMLMQHGSWSWYSWMVFGCGKKIELIFPADFIFVHFRCNLQAQLRWVACSVYCWEYLYQVGPYCNVSCVDRLHHSRLNGKLWAVSLCRHYETQAYIHLCDINCIRQRWHDILVKSQIINAGETKEGERHATF